MWFGTRPNTCRYPLVLSVAFQRYIQSMREFSLPILDGAEVEHKAIMKASYVTYYSCYVSYQVDTVKNKGTLRSNCMKKLEECASWLVEADLDDVLRAKVAAIKKMS